MNFSKNKGGFTLAEVLISILILAIMLTGGLSFYFNSDAVIGQVSHKKLATEIANSILENLKKAGYDSLPAPGAGTPVALTSTDDPVGILKDLSATKIVTVTDLGNPVAYKQVEVSVTWTEADESKAHEIKFSTIMAP